MTSVRRFACVVALCGLAGCLRPKVELVLTLPKTVWEEGELLWYKLEVKNVGWKAVTIDDPFWAFQHSIVQNQEQGRGTYLLVTDSQGTSARRSRYHVDVHGGPSYWTNDCGGGVPCEKTGFHRIVLKPGQALAATPSIEAQVRTASATRPPEVMAQLSPYRGDGRFIDLTQAGRERHEGHRVLDSHSFLGPGRYRIKAVLNLRSGLAPLTPEEDVGKLGWCESLGLEACEFFSSKILEDQARNSPAEVAERNLIQDRAGRETLGLVYAESRPIDFEVVPAPRVSPASKRGAAAAAAPRAKAIEAFFAEQVVVGRAEGR